MKKIPVKNVAMMSIWDRYIELGELSALLNRLSKKMASSYDHIPISEILVSCRRKCGERGANNSVYMIFSQSQQVINLLCGHMPDGSARSTSEVVDPDDVPKIEIEELRRLIMAAYRDVPAGRSFYYLDPFLKPCDILEDLDNHWNRPTLDLVWYLAEAYAYDIYGGTPDLEDELRLNWYEYELLANRYLHCLPDHMRYDGGKPRVKFVDCSTQCVSETKDALCIPAIKMLSEEVPHAINIVHCTFPRDIAREDMRFAGMYLLAMARYFTADVDRWIGNISPKDGWKIYEREVLSLGNDDKKSGYPYQPCIIYGAGGAEIHFPLATEYAYTMVEFNKRVRIVTKSRSVDVGLNYHFNQVERALLRHEEPPPMSVLYEEPVRKKKYETGKEPAKYQINKDGKDDRDGREANRAWRDSSGVHLVEHSGKRGGKTSIRHSGKEANRDSETRANRDIKQTTKPDHQRRTEGPLPDKRAANKPSEKKSPVQKATGQPAVSKDKSTGKCKGAQPDDDGFTPVQRRRRK